MNTETPSTPSPDLPPLALHTRNGKVARLPKAVRDQINNMLLDGVPYATIIERLGPQGEGLNEPNLSHWKTGGYLDWLRDLQIAQAIQSKYELAKDIVEKAGGDNAPSEAVLHTVAANVCKFLVETDPATIRLSLLSDADKFTRFVNSMVRLAEGAIKCQVHKFASQDRAAEAAKRRNPAEPGGISEESLRLAEQKLKLL